MDFLRVLKQGPEEKRVTHTLYTDLKPTRNQSDLHTVGCDVQYSDENNSQAVVRRIIDEKSKNNRLYHVI